MKTNLLESLEMRSYFAGGVSAVFDEALGVLNVFGDKTDNTIIITRDAAGNIGIDANGKVKPKLKDKDKEAHPTVANTVLIQVFGDDGNDVISLSEINGALPKANLFGGIGNDVLTGGSGADQLFGQAGNDELLGKGGVDFLFGGTENDVLTGGVGDDQAFGEAGDDRMVWNPGDDTDLNEGGNGADTVEVNGGNGAEQFTVTPNGARVRFDRVDPAPFSIDIGTSENLVLNANGGDDLFTASNGLATLIKLAADGGAGDDELRGGDGDDQLLGGDGDDFIDGNRGNDTAFMGAGEDTFQWDPGDASDIVEGEAGEDHMIFNGANIGETFALSANGGRFRLTRNVATITMDTDDVERVTLNALAGGDTTNIGDLTGTDVIEVNVNVGPVGGDAQFDKVVVNGTNGDDAIEVVGAGPAYAVIGLQALVTVDANDSSDVLVLNALGGNDTITATTLPATTVLATLDAGVGNDTVLGGAGDDVIVGSDGEDFIDGNRGADIVVMGAGDDTFQWDPGDGNDIVEGEDGIDTMLFNGSGASEEIDISANGGRVRFTRNVAAIVMDLNDLEVINFNALGGADKIVVNDLSGTDVFDINIDLATPPGSGTGDGQSDSIIVNGGIGDDLIQVQGNASTVSVLGLPARLDIVGHEADKDALTINGLGGADVIDAFGLAANVISYSANGGLGNDVFVGSQGDDLVNGGDGQDLAVLGAGDDTFIWNPGDDNDTFEGQSGFDRMIFNGANISEEIGVSANGARVRFTRNVAAITMDLNDVEGIDFNALGGADKITVGDMSGTDLTELNLNLAASGGIAPDGAADTVIVNGTNDADAIQIVGDANAVSVLGLSAVVNVTKLDPGLDTIQVNALGGDDVITATGLQIGSGQDGGEGDDILIGGDGDDTIFGGEGDDVLIGGPGSDTLDGGPGANVVFQD